MCGLLYSLPQDLLLERYEDRGVVLLAGCDRFITLNRAAMTILGLLQNAFGEASFSRSDLSALLSKHYDLTAEQAAEKANDLLASWSTEGLLRIVPDARGQSGQGADRQTRFIANTDWVLSEEDEDGGVLFHPDTGAVWVLNRTAMAIWNLLDGQRTVADVLMALHERFEGMDAAADEQVMVMMRHLYRIEAVSIVKGIGQ